MNNVRRVLIAWGLLAVVGFAGLVTYDVVTVTKNRRADANASTFELDIGDSSIRVNSRSYLTRFRDAAGDHAAAYLAIGFGAALLLVAGLAIRVEKADPGVDSL